MKQNKILLMLLAALLMPLAVAAQTTSVTSKCVLLLKAEYTNGGTNSGLDDDEIAAANWFYTNYASVIDETGAAYKGQILTYSEFESATITPSTTPVIWVHIDNAYTSDYSTALGYITLSAAQKTKLANYVKDGGNLFLTNYATPLVEKLGRISATYTPKLMNDGADNKKGINPEIGFSSQEYDHRNHPLFKGLTSQTRDSHIYYPLVSGTNEGTGLKWDFNESYMGLEDKPNKLMQFEVRTNSIVLGAWEHVTDYACAGLIEFLPVGDFKGRIIANGMGGYEWASSGNTYQANIETLTSNALTYLSKKKLKQVAYLLPTNIVDNFDKATALGAVDHDDEKTALTWFYDELVSSGEGIVLRPKDLADLDPTAVSTMWIHIDRDTKDAGEARNDGRFGDLDHTNMYHLLQRYVKNGGNLLLTKHAVRIVGTEFINRAKDNPNVFDVGVGKENNDVWAINAVIGGGYVIDQSTTETYKYWNYDAVATDGSNGEWAGGTVGTWPTKDEKKYVSYFWRNDNHYVAQLRSTGQTDGGDIWDNRSHHLYYKMEVNDGTNGQTPYPIGCASGFGTVKYEVINIVGSGYKEDHNCMWVFQGEGNPDGMSNLTLYFQRNNKADVLGQWAHKTQLDNAAIVDFKPCLVSEIGESMTTKGSDITSDDWKEDAWEGNILCIGLGAYEWQPSDTAGDPQPGENPYLDNIKQLTLNALNVLENDLDDAVTTTFTIDDVDYVGVQKNGTSYAMISKGASSLEKYDLVGTDSDSNPKDGYVTYNSVSYPITTVGVGAFTQCSDLAYADLIDFKGIVPDDIRNRFPEHTLIYLPTTSEVTGQNIVNTQNSTKTCEELKVFDKKFWANKYGFTTRKMSYTRDYTTEATQAEKYKTTVALPFPIDVDHAAEFGKFYKFNGVKNSSANYKLVASTEAYQPYMFMPKASAIGFTSATDVTIPALEQDEVVATSSTDGGEFIARYRYITFDPADSQSGYAIYAYKKGTAPDYNTFVTTSKYINVNPFRVYLKTPKANSARMLLMTFDDSEVQPTEIDGITTQPVLGSQPVYDLSGRRVQLGADLSRLTRGIYIIGGRKVVIK